ncbi:MAG TPA: division plane positioning ATPase MipZ [Gaiellaceae bacterium]|nr:division plane positioning ATPase MipZ [Gaiellaceae bacterium]
MPNEHHMSTTAVLPNRPVTLADYVEILKRRKWIVAALPIATGFVAFLMTVNDVPSYRADALVLLNRSNVVSTVTNTQDPAVFDSTRFLTTQANVARSPKLAARVAAGLEIPGLTAGAVLGASRVQPETGSDMLRFTASWSNPDAAVALANRYAQEYTRFKAELDTARINSALREIRARLRALEARGQVAGAAYQTLVQYQNQLTIGRFLSGDSATLLRPAGGAGEVRASATRNFLVGALLGLLMGIGIALLLEALDRAVRREEEFEGVLGLPLLARISGPPRPLRMRNRLLMFDAPLDPRSEVFRRLRTNIDFLNVERHAKTIMFTSAVPGEGKSTTAANTAIAFARAGRRVALVDLDVRRPTLHTFFDVPASHGIAQVALSDESLDAALRQVVLPAAGRGEPATNGQPSRVTRSRWVTSSVAGDTRSAYPRASRRPSELEHILHVLPCGPLPATTTEFLENPQVKAVLDEIRNRFELVVIDAPPLLAAGDAVGLAANVDAMVVVTHIGIRRSVLHDLARQLESCGAAQLGYVLTRVPRSDEYTYGYGYTQGLGGHGSEAQVTALDRLQEGVARYRQGKG